MSEDSGPFCPHWGDPGDCDRCKEICQCGHAWIDHDVIEDRPVAIAGACEDCDVCPKFKKAVGA